MEVHDLLPCGQKQQFQTKLRYLSKHNASQLRNTAIFKLAVARRPDSPQIQVSEAEPNLAFGRQYSSSRQTIFKLLDD